MDECFACFSDMCGACSGDCGCTHSMMEEQNKPVCGGPNCTMTKTLAKNAAYVDVHHKAPCRFTVPGKGQATLLGVVEA